MPLMPAREPRPEPLARARARLEFDALVRRRVDGIANPSIAAGPVGQGDPPTPAVQRAQLVEALARSFADAVDRENSSRGILRVGVQVEYVDAVVVTGGAGDLVVDAPEYDGALVYWQARAAGGSDDDVTVIHGRDLDAYLRTGEQRYAVALGLA